VEGGGVKGEELLVRYAAGEREFVEANLQGASLREANLEGAILEGANLQGASLREANLKGANLKRANLRGANLLDAKLYGASLQAANLSFADLLAANLERANLDGTNLLRADLRGANLEGGSLRAANLHGAYLQDANLRGANLEEADLWNVTVHARHLGPLLNATVRRAIIDWSAVAWSLDIPDCDLIPFLARTGMPLVLATYTVEALRSVDATELFTMLQSVFISYGRYDHDVSEAIRTSLGENGVKTWWWPDNAPAGGRTHRVVRTGIKKYDRMVLLISDSSLRRQGVINEIVECLQREAREGASDVVIPVVLDGAIYGEWWTADVESGADGTRPPTEHEIEQRKDIHGVLMERVHVDLKGAEPGDAKWNDGMRRILAVLKKDPYDS
jgi:hypothetical protein